MSRSERRKAISEVMLLAAMLAIQPADVPETVPRVDLQRYAGRWFEIGRFPNRFQRDCSGDVVVFYAVRPDGRLDVDNRCRQADGATNRAVGVARVEPMMARTRS